MITTVLTNYEARFADWIGKQRDLHAKNQNLRPYGGQTDTEIKNMIGARHEYAACKAFNRHWHPTVGTTDQPDIPPNIQIRGVTKDTHNLLLKPHEKDDHIFILSYGSELSFTLKGWMYGHQIKKFPIIKLTWSAGLRAVDLHKVEPEKLHPMPENLSDLEIERFF